MQSNRSVWLIAGLFGPADVPFAQRGRQRDPNAQPPCFQEDGVADGPGARPRTSQILCYLCAGCTSGAPGSGPSTAVPCNLVHTADSAVGCTDREGCRDFHHGHLDSKPGVAGVASVWLIKCKSKSGFRGSQNSLFPTPEAGLLKLDNLDLKLFWRGPTRRGLS